ncbi:MAG: DUF2737 family protein [Sphingobacterium sp.]
MNLDTEYALQRYTSMGARELCAGNKSGYKQPTKKELLSRNSFPSVNENKILNNLFNPAK